MSERVSFSIEEEIEDTIIRFKDDLLFFLLGSESEYFLNLREHDVIIIKI